MVFELREEIVMSIRCASCGSNKVTETTKKDSFSMGKAVAGTVLFGSVGAVMGVNGKETKWYYCPTCGATLNRLLPDYLASSIDASIETGGTDSMRASYWGAEWSSAPATAPAIAPSVTPSFDANQVRYLIDKELPTGNVGKYDFIDKVTAKLLKLNYSGLEYLSDKYIQARDVCESQIDNCLQEMYTEGRLIYENDIEENDGSWFSYIYNDNMARRNALIIKGLRCYEVNREIIDSAFKELLLSFSTDVVSRDEFEKRAFELTGSRGWGNNDVMAQAVFESFVKQNIWCDYDGDEVKINRLYITDNEAMKAEEKRRRKEKERANTEQVKQRNDSARNDIISLLADGNKYNLSQMLEILKKKDISYAARSTTGLSGLISVLVKNGIVARESVKKIAYFYLPEAVEEKRKREEKERAQRESERKERERERKAKIDAMTAPLKQQMAQKQQELNEQTQIYTENKRKIFGKGAKAKKEAQTNMNVLTQEINQLKSEIARIEAQ